MAFFVKVVTGGLAQVSIFLTRWLVTATSISSQGFGCIDPNRWGGALRPEAVSVAIVTILITPTLLLVPARSLGLGGLGPSGGGTEGNLGPKFDSR